MAEVRNGVFFSWFTSVLSTGWKRTLNVDDLPPLPSSFSANKCFQRIVDANLRFYCTQYKGSVPTNDASGCSWVNSNLNSNETPRSAASMHPLLRTMISAHWQSIVNIFLLKMFSCGLSFATPLLLGELVSFLGGPVSSSNVHIGILLVVGLSVCSVVSAIINVNSNARSLDIKLKLQSALTTLLFERVIALPRYAWTDVQVTYAQLLNFV
jgi:uncharacterized membrane protein (DUF485 family)